MNCMAKLELHIQSDGELAFQMSSLFHGVLMEILPEDYAEYLHQSGLHPFSQHLEKRQENGIGLFAVSMKRQEILL